MAGCRGCHRAQRRTGDADAICEPCWARIDERERVLRELEAYTKGRMFPAFANGEGPFTVGPAADPGDGERCALYNSAYVTGARAGIRAAVAHLRSKG